MTYIIAIANEKGGVAKTTTTLSLGAALSESGAKVLMIDLDTQANLSLATGLESGKSERSISRVLLDNQPLSSVIQSTAYPDLWLVPSSSEMGMAERFLPGHQLYERTLSKAIQEAPGEYQYILLDCPPFLGAVTTNALVASDLLLIPTQAEFFSVYALKNLMAMVKRIRSQANPRLTYRLLLTMVDRRNKIHRILSEQLRNNFGAGVLESVIETDTKLRECIINGTPIIYHAPKTRSAIQYRSLAQEIMKYAQEAVLQPAG
jgi:chromosome partitioning protein